MNWFVDLILSLLGFIALISVAGLLLIYLPRLLGKLYEKIETPDQGLTNYSPIADGSDDINYKHEKKSDKLLATQRYEEEREKSRARDGEASFYEKNF